MPSLHAEDEPTKPTKAPSVGYVGSVGSKSEAILKRSANGVGLAVPDDPSPGTPDRCIVDRVEEAKQLLEDMHELWQERAAIIQNEPGQSRSQAERLATAEIKTGEIYHQWLSQG